MTRPCVKAMLKTDLGHTTDHTPVCLAHGTHDRVT
ncbi:hypothetical protein F383_02698 [Gossypium arboreum]|uniref:Uncharacterized protein n=1 Tax=Gossypium arboreum TaxID=29729 RepID=A0A0B0PGC0_GOSAR|nr:hypothetical protein F383_02698 [Gossypium arboreum]